jgi:hypothetical protein
MTCDNDKNIFTFHESSQSFFAISNPNSTQILKKKKKKKSGGKKKKSNNQQMYREEGKKKIKNLVTSALRVFSKFLRRVLCVAYKTSRFIFCVLYKLLSSI